MSTQADNTETAQEATNEPQIIVSIEGEKSNPLTLDLDSMSVKQLADFERKQLLDLCIDKKLLTHLKKWEIARLNRQKLAQILKDSNSKKESTSEAKEKLKEDETKTASQNNFKADTQLLQVGILELFENKEPIGIDKFCTGVVSSSQYAIVSEETAQKFEKYLYYISLLWLGYRKIFGTFATLKGFLLMVKNRLNRKKEGAKNADSDGQKENI